ncbi:MAG: hypothetical protein ACI3YK_04275 [Eubacteriales bacterium]
MTCRDYDRKRVFHGHYFTGNYDGAKQDVATRSGLIPVHIQTTL